MSIYLVFTILIFFFVLYANSQECAIKHSNVEKQLHKDLLCDYMRDMRPRENSQESVNVTIRMVMKTLSYSYEFASIGILNVGSWMVLIWKDDYLNWKPEKYGGLLETVIHSSKIWTPNLSLYNSPETPQAELNTPCLVSASGIVTCIPHMMFRAICTSNYKRWPRDQQNCTLTFGTWMQKGEEVRYDISKKKPMDITTLEPNKYWEVLKFGADRHLGAFACCPNTTYPTVSFWVVIQRHTASAVAFLLTPAIVMIAITLSSLWLDLNSVERIMLMMLNLYLHILYIQEIAQLVPSNGDVLSNSVIYFRDSMLLSCAVLLEGIAMRTITKKKSVAPRWITVVTGFMNTGAGKIIMFHEFDPATSAMVAEDAENLSKEEMESSASKEWMRFALIVNRMFFILVCIIYLILFLNYLL